MVVIHNWLGLFWKDVDIRLVLTPWSTIACSTLVLITCIFITLSPLWVFVHLHCLLYAWGYTLAQTDLLCLLWAWPVTVSSLEPIRDCWWAWVCLLLMFYVVFFHLFYIFFLLICFLFYGLFFISIMFCFLIF